jgi:hypothetical protein
MPGMRRPSPHRSTPNDVAPIADISSGPLGGLRQPTALGSGATFYTSVCAHIFNLTITETIRLVGEAIVGRNVAAALALSGAKASEELHGVHRSRTPEC